MATGFDRGRYRADLAGVVATTGGAILGLANPESADVIITRAILNVTTPSNGAAAVDVGVGATATTSNDTLIDGKSVAVAGVFDNIEDQGTNGKSAVKWGSGQYLTVTGSADTTGLVGELILDYVLL